jgi:hypothetical protein
MYHKKCLRKMHLISRERDKRFQYHKKELKKEGEMIELEN